MVNLMNQICKFKMYKEETFFQAVSIADRFLAILAVYH